MVVKLEGPKLGSSEEDEGVDVPDELEDIVEALLCGLRDRDTVVRWSAAKGIGRITERLPHDLGEIRTAVDDGGGGGGESCLRWLP